MKNRLITTPEIISALNKQEASAIWKIIRNSHVHTEQKYMYLGQPGTQLYSPEPGFLHKKDRIFVRPDDNAVMLHQLGPVPTIGPKFSDIVDGENGWEYKKVADVPLWAVPNWYEVLDVSYPKLPSQVNEFELKMLGFHFNGSGWTFPGIVTDCITVQEAFRYVFKYFFGNWKETRIEGKLVNVAYKFDDDDDIIEPVNSRLECRGIVPYIEIYHLSVMTEML